MRIAFDALNIRKGGGETVLVRLARAFADSGHAVRVLTGEESLIDRLDPATRDAIRPVHVPMAASAMGALRYRHGAWRRDVTPTADVVFGFNYRTPGPTFQATYHINVIPFLPFAEQRAAVGAARAAMYRAYAGAALRWSDLNLFESRHILSLAEGSGLGPIRDPAVRYIGVEGPGDTALPSGPSVDHPYVCAVTSGARHKRNGHLFAMHRLLNDGRPADRRVGLTIVGLSRGDCEADPAMAEHRALIAGDPSIRLLGYVDRPTLYATLAGATALVSFSELESFYMVAVEAMAVGCPTVTADISSVAESVGPAGLLFPAGDAAAAAAHVRALLDPTTRAAWSDKARAWAGRFDGAACAQAIVETVEEAYDARARTDRRA